MLNRFDYADDIPPAVRNRLVDREPLCEEAVFEQSPLLWTRETDESGRPLYVLTKRGLVDLRLAMFSEDEALRLPDEAFKNRVFIQDVEDQRRRETEYIEQRLQDWHDRLQRLFTEVEEWAPASWQILHGQVVQREEDLMRRYSIAPRELPTLTLLRNTHRVAFVPSALWLVGADGRVNVTVDAKQHILVDRRIRPGEVSDWQIVLHDRRSQMVSFTRDVFLSILGGVS